jgi:DMSO/TMAO reductase YedYZ molybdopterin-dependent catalytic subunit
MNKRSISREFFKVFSSSTIALLLLAASQGAEVVISVTGQVKTPTKLTMTELKAMPSVKVTAEDHDGTTAVYEGIPLADILRRAGAPQGESVRGEALQLCVLVKATDGYQVAFSLAELDPLFTDRKVILAYLRNGLELDAKAGPLRLVIPDEKRQGRWVRQVTELEIIRVGSSK